jgi:hypothetical protein
VFFFKNITDNAAFFFIKRGRLPSTAAFFKDEEQRKQRCMSPSFEKQRVFHQTSRLFFSHHRQKKIVVSLRGLFFKSLKSSFLKVRTKPEITSCDL